jgi:DegV family protein with EDD domain
MSAGRIAVVTDSSACLPAELIARHGITMVPLQVVIGAQSLDEGVQVSAENLSEALKDWAPVSTSRPSPARFAQAYHAAADAGASAVVSVHLSAQASGTHESALLAAKDSPIEVRAVDSRQIGMGLGFAVIDAAVAAAEGADLDAVVAAAEKRAAAAATYFYVDTVEYLRRGGRVNAAQALLSSALAVKPLLHLVDGRIVPLEKVRTASRALTRLEEVVVGRAGSAEVDIAVHHLGSPDRAATLAGRLRERLPGLGDLYVTELGAAIGAHVGPRAVGVVVAAR